MPMFENCPLLALIETKNKSIQVKRISEDRASQQAINATFSAVDCKVEHHFFGFPKGFNRDVHLCNRIYNSFGHYLQKAGKYESNDIIGTNRN